LSQNKSEHIFQTILFPRAVVSIYFECSS